MFRLFFSFQGRLNRARYWLGELIRWVALVGLVALSTMATGASWQGAAFDDLPLPLQLFWMTTGALWIYAGLALQAKRWHDRDKSGFWILVNLVPYVGGLIAFIECGCRRGTTGSNRFGPDPRDGNGAPATPARAPATLSVRIGTV